MTEHGLTIQDVWRDPSLMPKDALSSNKDKLEKRKEIKDLTPEVVVILGIVSEKWFRSPLKETGRLNLIQMFD
jgi:hypothetical protein